MFQNYFKLAVKVLGRRKFFTFVSLFGISFTLMVLMLLTSFLDAQLGANKPLTEKDRMVFFDRGVMKYMRLDTIWEIDSTLLDGVMVYDSTLQTEENQESYSSSSVGWYLLNEYLRDLEQVERYSFSSGGRTFDFFLNGKKMSLSGNYTDAGFWQIYDYDFVEGQAYGVQQIDNQAQVVILNTETAEGFFGTSSNVVGKTVDLQGKSYEVVGVVKRPSTAVSALNSDVFLPITHMNPRRFEGQDFLGSFEAVFMTYQANQKEEVIAELKRIGEDMQMPNPEEYNRLIIKGKTFSEGYASEILEQDEPKKSKRIMILILAGLLSLFVLIPTLNLINLNISRILERSDEIGVRKAFGATSRHILTQFVFENIILTFIGGIIGLGLALLALNIFNRSKALGDVVLHFNFNVFLWSLFICLLFGILSGVIPAFRMSRMNIINALKQNQL
ncbi:MAG: FtsX-like permease family protein [Bacteroidota bacterium]